MARGAAVGTWKAYARLTRRACCNDAWSLHSNRTTLFHSSPLYTLMSCDFFITFIAYRLPQSRFTTSSTWPKPPCPRTRTALKWSIAGVTPCFARSWST